MELTEKEKKNKLIKEVVKPLFKSAGYKLRGNTIYSEREDCYLVIYIQSSYFNMAGLGYSFWFNIFVMNKKTTTLEEVKKSHGVGLYTSERLFLPDNGYLHPYHSAYYTIGRNRNYKPVVTDYDDAAKRIQYDIETYILPRLADVQTMNEWKELKRELYKEQSTKRVKLITFFYNAVSSACSTSNLAKSRMLFKESGLSKDDVLENMDLLQEVLKYEDEYGNDVKGYISMVLENMN